MKRISSRKGGRRYLVRIRQIDKPVSILDLAKPIGSLLLFAVEATLIDARAKVACDLDRPVLAEGIEHDDIVAPTDRGEARRQIEFLVECQDEHRDVGIPDARRRRTGRELSSSAPLRRTAGSRLMPRAPGWFSAGS